MLIHRCPWCGEELSILPKTKCPVCKNSITAYRNKEKGIPKSGILFLLILCFLFFPFRYPFAIIDLPLWADLIHYIILDVIVLCLLGSSPYRRGYVKQNNSNCIQKNQICASISWEAHKNEGLLCPKLQVPNGEIFSACFIDANGQPISTALCVVLENIHWENPHRCTCTIKLVLDDVAAQDLFQKHNTLNLYYKYRLIAKGIVQ